VLLLGAVGVVIGSAFISQGIVKQDLIRTEMQEEKVTYLLSPEEVAKGNVIDTEEEAQMVADKVKEDRHKIAATYNDLLQGGKYDPTNPKHLSYSQAINLENYLYLGVLAYGLTTVVLVSGIFMIVTGIALGGIGVVLLGLRAKRA
jgi:hypothetical protein